MIDRLHIALIGLVATGCAMASAFDQGRSTGRAEEQAAQARAQAAATAARRELQGRLDAAGQRQAESETGRQAAVQHIREHTREIIERPVYRNICLDADGVSAIDALVAIANGKRADIAAPAGHAPDVPDPAAQP